MFLAGNECAWSIDVKYDFLSYAVNCKVAGHFQLSSFAWFDTLRLKRKSRILGGVEEISTRRSLSRHLNPRVDGRSVDLESDWVFSKLAVSYCIKPVTFVKAPRNVEIPI